MSKKQELLDEYSDEVGGDSRMSIEDFLNFLVRKIENLEAKLKKLEKEVEDELDRRAASW